MVKTFKTALCHNAKTKCNETTKSNDNKSHAHARTHTHAQTQKHKEKFSFVLLIIEIYRLYNVKTKRYVLLFAKNVIINTVP
jgi:hypothetical protein